MAGFPGAGKDTWLETNYAGPVISLDQIREETGASADGDQGPVLQVARQRANTHLEAGESFAWNATNVARELRGQVIDLAAVRGARVRMVWVEAKRAELWERNRNRPRPAPEWVIDSMLERWDTPDLCEAHDVQRIW